MLSFLIFRPDASNEKSPILIFLHGLGEAFANTETDKEGFKHLFQQGAPKVLWDPKSLLPKGHPLRAGEFAVVVPQLMIRETPWIEPGHVQQIQAVLGTISPAAGRRLYVMGFSKGGQAAFRLAAELEARAIVTIDASPMGENVDEVAREISLCGIPFWSIYTSYPSKHRFERISNLHHGLRVEDYPIARWSSIAPPPKNAKCKSLISLEHHRADVRHGELCTVVTTSSTPYDWLVKH